MRTRVVAASHSKDLGPDGRVVSTQAPHKEGELVVGQREQQLLAEFGKVGLVEKRVEHGLDRRFAALQAAEQLAHEEGEVYRQKVASLERVAELVRTPEAAHVAHV